MNIRLAFSIILALLSGAIAVCAVVAFHSEKEIGKPLGSMLLKLIPPIIGNALIIIASSKPLATVGCYMYYIGIDFSVFGLLRYVLAYGKLEWRSSGLRILVLSLFGLDILQLLANIAFGHAFSIEAIELYGSVYYRMIPYLPQNLHRALVYAVLAASVVILFLKMIHSSRIHARRYGVLLTSLLVVIVWCSFYVISRTPLDRSMIGYAVFGLLAFYFSLYYKPVRLLNRIMVDMSAELSDALFFFDDAGACIWANNKGQQLAGVSAGHFQGVEEKLKPFFESGGEGDSWTSTLELDEGGNRKYYALEKRTIRDGKGRIDGSFLNIRDDTQAQLNLQQETYRARHDELTGLYNRPYLYQCISRMLTEAEPGAAYNVVFINVSNFKLINDIFGHSFGDKVLIRIARLLREHVPEGGVYGRLAGDTFGVFLPVGAMRIDQVERTVSSFAVSTGVTDYHVLIHLGVYRVVDPVLEVSVMFDRARIAASNVRNDYHTHIAFYDDAMRSRMLWEQEISFELQGALEDRQIVPFLQPLVDTQGRVVGAEALVRWNHPVHGFMSPASFIPIFERNGMIAEVDRYMWRRACEQLARWRDNDLFISINISPKDFYFSDVAGEIKALVREFGVEPSRLRVEITESTMIADVDNKVDILSGLREAGFVVEMDDFGSGYSSLNLLKDMPIDVIKIDMGFLRSAERDEKSSKILRNIINMATDLDIVPLSEGVETRAQYEDLAEMGCKMFQGYYFAKPMPVEDFEARYLTGAGTPE